MRCLSSRGRRRGQRLGFTKVDLAVVSVVVVALASWMLMGVQRVRPTGRSTQCRNQLKNVVLAMHNFESAMGRLPGKNAASVGRWSMFTDLLPYIEQQALSNRLNLQAGEPSILELPDEPARYGELDAFPLNLNLPECARSNWQTKTLAGSHRLAVTTRIPAYVCPSDLGPLTHPGGLSYVPVVSPSHPEWADRGARTTSGKLLEALWPASSEAADGKLENPQAIPDYASRMNPPTVEGIADGSSYTIGLAERVKGRHAGGLDGPENSAWYGADGSGFVVDDHGSVDRLVTADNSARVDLCRRNAQQNVRRLAGRNYNDLSGVQWLQYTCVWMGCANTLGPPNSPVCSAGGSRAIAESGIAPPSSRHGGGANCGFMDGTVRFITDGIDLRVFHALGTINGGERHSDEKHGLNY